jgi:hypothetical protein
MAAAEQPNERWQADTTHRRLAEGTEVDNRWALGLTLV